MSAHTIPADSAGAPLDAPLTVEDLENRLDAAYRRLMDTYTARSILHDEWMSAWERPNTRDDPSRLHASDDEPDDGDWGDVDEARLEPAELRDAISTVFQSLDRRLATARLQWLNARRAYSDARGLDLARIDGI